MSIVLSNNLYRKKGIGMGMGIWICSIYNYAKSNNIMNKSNRLSTLCSSHARARARARARAVFNRLWHEGKSS